MIFSSYKFLLLFLPVVLGGYVILNKLKLDVVAKLWLVIASFYFYAQGSKSFFPFFVATVFFNYVIGSSINSITGENASRNRKMLLAIGVLENIILLGYFKYTNFFITNINMFTGTDFVMKKIILPIGISFFSFTLIAYLVDSYRGHTKEYGILKFLLFIAFFPHLIVGPIIHHKDIVPQFEAQPIFRFNKENVILAVFLFSIGCGKKLMLADPLTAFAEAYFSNVHVYGVQHFWQSWICTISYTISYYFDLSGYADMAIGLGLLFNIKFPPNFNSPYRARNFADYWRRWHMTLSKFLSDYIFRSVYRKGAGSFNFYLAVMVTFFVSGFWHGAGWTFIVWGLINGIFVVIAHFMERRGWKFPLLTSQILTFLGVMGTRVLFVSNTFSDALRVYKTMFNIKVFFGQSFLEIITSFKDYSSNNLTNLVTLCIGLAICFFAKNTTQISIDFKPTLRYAVLAGFSLAISLFLMGGVSKFLYFQF
jgi:alginate O-acetyltransferase complex protein AlgI